MEGYLCMGGWCVPWLRYGGKWTDLGIWNEKQSRNETWKNSISRHFNYFPNLDNKITHLGIWNHFVTNLAIPNIWLLGHLDQKINYASHPETFNIKFACTCGR